MTRTLPLYGMTPDTLLEGTVLARGPHHTSEIEQCIREAMDMLDDTFEFPITRHPAMRPDVGFIDLVSLFLVSFPRHRSFAIRS
jgi:hypothetical protein